MADDTETDGAAAAAGGAAAPLPAFPRALGRTAVDPTVALPPPLKLDSTFRGAEAVRPALRAVPSGPSPAPAAPVMAAASAPAAALAGAAARPEPVRDSEPARELPAEEPAQPVEDDEPRIAGLRLPYRRPKVSRGRQVWFLLSFVLPVILGAFYLFAIAPDEYVTEFRFSVRLPISHSTTNTAEGSAKSFLFDGNTTPGTDLLDNYTVADYVTTRQAAIDLNQRVNLREMYSRPFDPLSRVGKNASVERLAKFWHGMVYSTYDSASGLAVVKVKAYTAQDSFAIANNLVQLSSDLVNKIGSASQSDSVRYAEQEVETARNKVLELQKQLVGLRRESTFILPGQQGTGEVAADQGMVAQFTLRQSRLREQINELMAQLHNPEAPQIKLLRQQYAANEHELAEAQRALGGGTPQDLASRFQKFQFIQSQISNANAVLTSATSNLAITQAAANSQRIYLTTYVKPTLPEAPTAPNRWLDLFIVVIASAMIWAIGRLVQNSIMEHG